MYVLFDGHIPTLAGVWYNYVRIPSTVSFTTSFTVPWSKMLERYATAARSTNLRNDERHSAIDAIVAMGCADVPYGSLAIRAKYGDFISAKAELLSMFESRCVQRAKARKWPVEVQPGSVAKVTVGYFLSPSCRSCTGAKEIGFRVCPDCEGTGTRPIDATPQERPFVDDGLAFLNQTVARAVTAASAKLRSR